jgi:hypothetical protein
LILSSNVYRSRQMAVGTTEEGSHYRLARVI